MSTYINGDIPLFATLCTHERQQITPHLLPYPDVSRARECACVATRFTCARPNLTPPRESHTKTNLINAVAQRSRMNREDQHSGRIGA